MQTSVHHYFIDRTDNFSSIWNVVGTTIALILNVFRSEMIGIKRNTSTLLEHFCFITNFLVLRRARIFPFCTKHRRIKWMHEFSLVKWWHFRLGAKPVANIVLCFRCRWQIEVGCSMNRTRSQISKYCGNTGRETVVPFDMTVSPDLMLEFFDCRCHSHQFKWK